MESEILSQNQHIQRSVNHTQKAVDWLINNEFTILSVYAEGFRPIIWIQNETRCSELNGGMMVSRSTPIGPETIMAAIVNECQVQWVIRGH